ncbi:hypothetical protein SAMN03159511_1070 [Pseudomonas sp. NFACC19-2]|uniref:Uncharacterized protein n=1 Tax=Ectopseudomonas toyotomiensis TaxID=554344 RepID=A0A1I5N2V8_9GAMM|nr:MULTISPECIES: hypothetical protein [Pseudomonas]QSL91316.1 hypothetical protein JWV26_16280 [Pseudomonas toyotomiensis]SDA53649.1 hypothetical protein SAMN03159475_1460 [Pseudomonas sp. NFPP33]SFP16083.1 hypothetical protein SAMN05216177_101468 [Pseudomonas toyotomiensis]SFW17319.1 hypothetical protein SAMN03159511_1070 [Pseudomonas sp. NFACC19-2]
MMTQHLGKLDWANPSLLPESKLQSVVDTLQIKEHKGYSVNLEGEMNVRRDATQIGCT